MKKLTDFKSEINKCSKCGLCQSVCPVYKETGNDCAVSRGKFVMLDGVIKGDLKLSKNINKYLDLCLKCGKCSGFCPSSIDVCEIFEIAKYEYMKKTFLGNIIFFLQSKFIFSNLTKLLKFCFNRTKHDKTNKKIKCIYFKGCVNNIFTQTDKFIKNILSNTDIEIVEKDFECCGLPFLSSGNLERFEEVKKHNLKMLNCEYDYILTACASCESTLKSYFKNDTAPEFINLGELIAKLNIKFKFPKPVKVTFHKPCHLKNDSFFEQIIENCENVKYIKMENYDDCCGFAGEFALKNQEISKKISHKKAENIIKTGTDYVITVCPACILGLKQGFLGKQNVPKVLSLTEFLNKALS